MTPNYALILDALYANKEWTTNGNTYDGITWLDDSTQPTQAELDAAWPQVEYQTQCQAIEQQRLFAYEKTSDPIFFKWQRGDATEAEWRAAVAKVKLDNPYPPAP